MSGVTHALQEDAADESASPVGLAGILPDDVPENISYDAWLGIGTNWETWGEETANLLSQLYGETPSDIAGQLALIAQLEGRLNTMEKAIADPRYRSIHDKLVDLHGKLNRRLIIHNTVLDMLTAGPDTAQDGQLESARQEVLANSDAAQQYLNRVRNGEGWSAYLRLERLDALEQQVVTAPGTLDEIRLVADRLGAGAQLSDPAQQEFLTQPVFAQLQTAVDNYLAAAQPAASSGNEQLRSHLGELVAALEQYEQTNSNDSAANVRAIYAEIKRNDPQGGAALTAALRETYFNYNLKIIASEAFLKEVISDTRQDSGDVVDCILGAFVTGDQTTISEIGVDLLPSADSVRMDIVVNGTVYSSTSGDKNSATIFTEGTHYYEARKEVVFKNEEFYAYPANIWVDANNYNYDAETPLSGIPILSGLGRRFALSRADSLRPEAEAIAESRVADRVLPQFNEEVNGQFGRASSELQQKLYSKLRDNNIYPSTSRYLSTDSHLWVNQRLMRSNELGGGIAPRQFDTDSGLMVQIHESMMNNALDELGFAGRTMTDEEVRTELETAFTNLLGRPVNLPQSAPPADGEEAGPNTFVFAESDPIRVRATGGQFLLVLKSGFQQEGRDDIPTQEITIPLSFNVDGDQINITRGVVAVAPVDQPESVAQQIAQAGVIRKKFDAQLPDRTVDGTIRLERPDNRPEIVLNVQAIKALNGWLTVILN